MHGVSTRDVEKIKPKSPALADRTSLDTGKALGTNAIENSFRNTRNKLGRVTRFRANSRIPVQSQKFTMTF